MNVQAPAADAVRAEALPLLRTEAEGNDVRMLAGGAWNVQNAREVDEAVTAALKGSPRSLTLDLRNVVRMDTSGAWQVERCRRAVQPGGGRFTLIGANPAQRRLIEALHEDTPEPVAPRTEQAFFERVGRGTVGIGSDFMIAMHVLGAAIRGPQGQGAGSRLRFTSVVHQLDQMGLRAVPVIALMNFLVGGIVAQQAAFQLKYYGEEILTASLIGLLVLREVGVLLTAILVAGRTGSAITAEIGTMKMREETDALTVMGLNPIGVLIFPRLLALVLAVPLLTIVANFAGIMGAMVMTYFYVAVPPELFLDALRGYIDHTTVGAGIIKAPFMALIIGLIAATEGLKVGGSAESLGQRVTASVVKAIFMVIVVDGFFAIFYAAIDY